MYWIDGEFMCATIHEFKNNISRFITILEKEHYSGILIYRRNKRVALLQALEPKLREMGKAGKLGDGPLTGPSIGKSKS